MIRSARHHLVLAIFPSSPFVQKKRIYITYVQCFSFQQYINKTGFRVCFKELYETKYDPLSIIYTVMSGKYLGCLTMLQSNVLLNQYSHI